MNDNDFCGYMINVLDIAQNVSKEDAMDFLTQGLDKGLITNDQFYFVYKTMKRVRTNNEPKQIQEKTTNAKDQRKSTKKYY
jgi:hypothetical protein